MHMHLKLLALLFLYLQCDLKGVILNVAKFITGKQIQFLKLTV